METFIQSILRILKSDTPTVLEEHTVGTGFLISRNLVVTCDHVLSLAGQDVDGMVTVCFSLSTTPIKARVMNEFWNPQRDVVILELDSVPDGVQPLHLAAAADCHGGDPFQSFGYATAADVQGIIARGTIDGYLPQHRLLQLQSPQSNHGISGAPVLNEKHNVVVGMITKGHTELGRNELTTFATPSETIWQVCPQLKPVTPPLPRRNPIVEGIHLLPYDYDQRIQNFLGEYLGSDQHPVPFGGRDDALKMLDNWLADTTPYLLLAAPAGRGKSALLVRWLDGISTREDLALTFVPVSIRFGTNMERVFYAALAARLAFLHGDDVPASPETSTAVYRGLVSDYLSKPLANGRTLLVVLDGLDEAADWQAGADFMPSELPTGVRVLVSARFLAGDADSIPWLRRLNWERSGLASAPSLVPLDQAGVADVLLKMSVPLEELSRNVDIVAELYRLSEGDPLLVSLYVGDLWAKGAEVTRLKPEDLAGIKPGYKGYFDRWWDDQEKLWGADTPLMRPNVQMLLNLLACALSGLMRADLVTLAPQELNRYTLDNAFKALQRFVIGDGVNFGYTFSHPKLGQYFWDALIPSEQAQMEGRFLAWGQETLQESIDGKRDPRQKDQIPAYVVRNYSAHLARAKQPIEKWLPLIHHQQWAQAWFTLEGAYGGYLGDVKHVREACLLLDRSAIRQDGMAKSIGCQIRCALIESSLHSLAEQIFPRLLAQLVRYKVWSLPQALVYIQQLTDAEKQSNAILSILPFLTQTQYSQVLDAVKHVKTEQYYAKTLNALVPYLPDEQIQNALNLVRELQDIDALAIGLGGLSQRMPELADEALLVTQKIEGEWFYADVLESLAEYMPKNKLSAVLELARKKDLWEPITKLIERLPDEFLQDVLDMTQQFQDQNATAIVYEKLIIRWPQDQLSQFLTDACQFNEDAPRAQVLRALIQYFPQDRLGELRTAVSRIKDVNIRIGVMGDLAQRLPEVIDETIETARQMEDKYRAAEGLSTLANFNNSIIAEEIVGPWLIASSPRHVFPFKPLPSDKLQKIWDCALQFRQENERSIILRALVYHLPESRLDDFLFELNRITSPYYHVRILIALAEQLPENRLPILLDLAQQIPDGRFRALILITLAERLPKVIFEALAASQQIQDWNSQWKILNTLIGCSPEHQLLEQFDNAQQVSFMYPRIEKRDRLSLYLPGISYEVLTEIIKRFADKWSDVNNPSALMHELPEDILLTLFDLACQLPNDYDRACTMAALSPFLPNAANVGLAAAAKTDDSRKIDVFSKLAERLPQDRLSEMRDLVKQLDDPASCAEVWAVLLKRLPEVAGDAIATATAIQSNWFGRAEVWGNFVLYLPDERLEELFDIAKNIEDEWWRAETLRALVERLPETRRPELYSLAQKMKNEEARAILMGALLNYVPGAAQEVLLGARKIQWDKWRAIVISDLADYLPETLGEALSATWAALESPEPNQLLEKITKLLESVPAHQSYPWFEKSMPVLAIKTRWDSFSALETMLPWLIRLGGKNVIQDIYQSVLDVSQWWP
jgi:hypothetical protein